MLCFIFFDFLVAKFGKSEFLLRVLHFWAFHASFPPKRCDAIKFYACWSLKKNSNFFLTENGRRKLKKASFLGWLGFRVSEGQRAPNKSATEKNHDTDRFQLEYKFL